MMMKLKKSKSISKSFFWGILTILLLSSAFSSLNWITSWMAMVIGFIFAFFFNNPYEEKIENITNKLLKVSIICIGFGYPIYSIKDLSSYSFY